MTDIMKLQNGSDIRGVAMEGIPGQEVDLTPARAVMISAAFVSWLSEKTKKAPEALRIGVGHDSRLTAESLSGAALSGVLSAGAEAYDCGLSSTPAMFMSLVFPETAFDGAVMITASHLPFNRNGLKFFDADGGLESADITAVLKKARALPEAVPDIKKAPETLPVPLLKLYAGFLREKIRAAVGGTDPGLPLRGLHIVTDAGNGAGGFFAEDVLSPLGADVTGSRYQDPDGRFPNHIPNPEDKAAMASIRAAVLENNADLGLIFDTDVDRMSAVLSDGAEVNRDAIIALVSAILAPEHPGGVIVTDSVTSDRLTAFLSGLGLRQRRFMRGYKNVINEQKRLNSEGVDCPLAMETSGHGALAENYFLDDGAYLAVRLTAALAGMKKKGGGLEDLIRALPPAFEEREYRFRISGEDFADYGKQVLEAFEKRAAEAGYFVVPDSREGVRLSFSEGAPKGWLLLRMSLHDPVMPLNMEGGGPGDCDRMKEIVRELLRGFERLDLSVL